MKLNQTNKSFPNNEEALITYIKNDSLDIIELLSGEIAKQLLTTITGYSLPLIVCLLKENSHKIISYLLTNYPSIKKWKSGKSKQNILMLSLIHSNCETIQLIITTFVRSDYSPDTRNNNELHYWFKYHGRCGQCLELMYKHALILKQSKYFTKETQNILDDLIEQSDEESVLFLLQKFPVFDIEKIKDSCGNNIVHKIAKSNLMNLLNEVDFSTEWMNSWNDKSETPLTIAWSNGNYFIAENLIDKGVEVRKMDKQLSFNDSNITLQLASKIRKNYCSEKETVFGSTRISILKSRKILENDISDFNKNHNNNNNNNTKSNGKYWNQSQRKEISDWKAIKFTREVPKFFSSKTNMNTESKWTISVSRKYQCNTHLNSSLDSISRHNKKPVQSDYNTRTNIKSSLIKNKQHGLVFSEGRLQNTKKKTNTMQKYCNKSLDQPSQKPRHEGFNNISLITLIKPISSMFIIPFNDLIINYTKPIHYSNTSTVYCGVYLDLQVTVKEYKNINSLSQEETSSWRSEINLCLSLHHPNIVSFLGLSSNNDNIYWITEFMSNSSLMMVIEKKSKIWTNEIKMKIAKDICFGIYYLHSRNPPVYHRDWKSSNILLNQNYTAKLCDFGISKVHREQCYHTNTQSTPYWMAPEFCIDGTFTNKSEMYSWGILLWELFMEDTLPYKNVNIMEYIIGDKGIEDRRPKIELDKIKDVIGVKELIERCWRTDPEERPDIKEVVEIIDNMIQNA